MFSFSEARSLQETAKARAGRVAVVNRIKYAFILDLSSNCPVNPTSS